jgi:hypothetical protein
LSNWDQTANSAPADVTAVSPTAAWSGGGIRSTVQDVANFYCALFSTKLLPTVEVAAMQDTHGDPRRLWVRPHADRRKRLRLGPRHADDQHQLRRAWGHGGPFPGYAELPISSPDGSRQAVLFVNADPYLIHKAS